MYKPQALHVCFLSFSDYRLVLKISRHLLPEKVYIAEEQKNTKMEARGEEAQKMQHLRGPALLPWEGREQG